MALTAAVLHATWNLLVARARDTEAATAIALITAEVVFAPLAVVQWHVDRAAIPYIVASGLLELAYIVLLAAAYVRVPLSVVYPVARGTAPVLVTVGSAVLLGVVPSVPQSLGVVSVATGVMLVRGLDRVVSLRLLALPLAVACTICGYTLVDREGIRHAAAIPYYELTGAIMLAYPMWLIARRGVPTIRAELRPASVVAGLAMFGAYALVLSALRIAPPGPVSAVRESSVVIATLLAAAFLGERVSRGRIAGAVLVGAGVVAIALS
jgi:drug/metabolite transporter (DMT)-like permease